MHGTAQRWRGPSRAAPLPCLRSIREHVPRVSHGHGPRTDLSGPTSSPVSIDALPAAIHAPGSRGARLCTRPRTTCRRTRAHAFSAVPGAGIRRAPVTPCRICLVNTRRLASRTGIAAGSLPAVRFGREVRYNGRRSGRCRREPAMPQRGYLTGGSATRSGVPNRVRWMWALPGGHLRVDGCPDFWSLPLERQWFRRQSSASVPPSKSSGAHGERPTGTD